MIRKERAGLLGHEIFKITDRVRQRKKRRERGSQRGAIQHSSQCKVTLHRLVAIIIAKLFDQALVRRRMGVAGQLIIRRPGRVDDREE